MHLIVAGATGLVGSAVLDYMLNAPEITKVSVVSRNPVPMADGHSKAQVIIKEDFGTWDEETLAKLAGAIGCVWSLGPSVIAVTKEVFTQVTRDWTIATAKAFATLSTSFKFVYVSHEGIEEYRRIRMPLVYDMKDQAEKGIIELSKTTSPSLKPYSVRPAVIDHFSHEALKPYIKYPLPLPKKLNKWFMPYLRWAHSSMVITSQDLSRILVTMATGDGKDITVEGTLADGRIVSNLSLHKLRDSGM